MGRWANKYVIGLTGNIAMGKSLVRKMFEHLGAYTIDADGLAHQVMVPGAPAYAPVIEIFGKWLLDKDNRIDRSKLGAVVFAHPEALARLEALTHPIVGQGIDTLISRARQPIVVVEAIKLIEGSLAQQVDAIWVVDTAPQIQMERLLSKRGMSEYEARKRIDTQNPQRDKLARASVVITNNGTPQDVWVQVEREWRKIVAKLGVQEQSDQVMTVEVSKQAQEQARQQAQMAPSRPLPTPPAEKRATGTIRPAVEQPPAVQQKTAAATMPAVPAQPPRPPTVTPPAAQPPKVAVGTPAQMPPKVATGVQPAAQQTPAKVATGPQPVVQPPKVATETMPPAEISRVNIRRGMPKNAEVIAQIINSTQGKTLNRVDIMTAFGEKSYLLAEANGRTVGLTGFQVENLITRMDEFIVMPGAPIPPVAEALIKAVEGSSKELQSEVGFMFLPKDAPAPLVQTFLDQGYEKTELDAIKVPAWREAAQESQPANTQILSKKLRSERVLKPL